MEQNKMCRTCLSISEDMKSLYEVNSASTQMSLADMLMSFTPLTCYESDDLPTEICYKCISELIHIHTFQAKCVESDEKLRNNLSNSSKTDEVNVFQNVFIKSELLQNSPYSETSNEDNPISRTDLDVQNKGNIKIEKNDLDSMNEINQNISIDKSLNDPLEMVEMQKNSDIDLVKHEIDDVKIEINKNVEENPTKKPFFCEICDKTFLHKVSLMNHMPKHTGEPANVCPTCGKSYYRKSTLTNHLRTHTGEKPYSCTVCNTSFTDKQTLKMHIKFRHSEERPYSCSLCCFSFKLKEGLVRHIRTHTGEKPYSCTVCDKTFNHRFTLSNHERTHSGARPYSCSVCDKTFNRNSTLVNHMRIHSGAKPYSCTFCDSSFTRKGTLTEHLRMHTGETPYSCTVCDQCFSQKKKLTGHMRRVHTN